MEREEIDGSKAGRGWFPCGESGDVLLSLGVQRQSDDDWDGVADSVICFD